MLHALHCTEFSYFTHEIILLPTWNTPSPILQCNVMRYSQCRLYTTHVWYCTRQPVYSIINNSFYVLACNGGTVGLTLLIWQRTTMFKRWYGMKSFCCKLLLLPCHVHFMWYFTFFYSLFTTVCAALYVTNWWQDNSCIWLLPSKDRLFNRRHL